MIAEEVQLEWRPNEIECTVRSTEVMECNICRYMAEEMIMHRIEKAKLLITSAALCFMPNASYAQIGVCNWGGEGYTWSADFRGSKTNPSADIATAFGNDVYVYVSTKLDFFLEKWSSTFSWGAPDLTWIGDFNGDDKSDIASTQLGSASVGDIAMYLSNGESFKEQTWKASSAAGWYSYPGCRWTGDFNGDGKSDIATGPWSDNSKSCVGITTCNTGKIDMHLSNGDGFDNQSWSAGGGGWNLSFPGLCTPYNWSADFNGDGADDIATAYQDGEVKVLLSNRFGFDSHIWNMPKMGDANRTWAADFSGDGRADIASIDCGNFLEKECNVYLAVSQGNAFKNYSYKISKPFGDVGYTWVADFTGDGKANIASAVGGIVNMIFFNEDQLVHQIWNVLPNWGSSGYTWVNDFNGDGKTDIASAVGCNIYMHLSTGERFGNQIWFATRKSN